MMSLVVAPGKGGEVKDCLGLSIALLRDATRSEKIATVSNAASSDRRRFAPHRAKYTACSTRGTALYKFVNVSSISPVISFADPYGAHLIFWSKC